MTSNIQSPTAAAAVAPSAIDEESLQNELEDKNNVQDHTLDSKFPGVSVSYNVSLSVDMKVMSETGKKTRGRQQKLILDEACGTVDPGQVRCVIVTTLDPLPFYAVLDFCFTARL